MIRSARTRSSPRTRDERDPRAVASQLSFDPEEDIAAPYVARGARPRGGDPARAGRQQPDRDRGGVRAGRLRAARRAHDRPARAGGAGSREFRGLVACGGFSYGDVLGAGEGWAKSILFHERGARAVRSASSRGRDTFALGICNGCQMFAALQEHHPRDAQHWPRFVQEPQRAVRSALRAGGGASARPRCCSPAWRGSLLPIAVAHGEGRAEFASAAAAPPARRADWSACAT